MEYVYTHTQQSRRDAAVVAEKVKEWNWSFLNEKLLQLVCDGKSG